MHSRVIYMNDNTYPTYDDSTWDFDVPEYSDLDGPDDYSNQPTSFLD